MEQKMPNFYSGTSNVVIPFPNKQCCPPEFQDKSRLAFYGSLNNSVEINSSFYRLPMLKTVAKWSAEVPDDFRFTYKLWKQVTHNKELAFAPEDVDRFMETIANAGEKKGCLLIQMPPSTTIAAAHQLEVLLTGIRHADPDSEWKTAVEFRNRSWYEPETYDLLEEFGAAAVLHDMPASAAPLKEQEADFVYLRFHGPNGGYRGSYEEGYLYEYAEYVKEWLAEGKTVYAYFNNTMGDALGNLNTLNSFVS
ncbi:MAG: hypothetical protein K0S09_2062 [Sphingobacteriaceae bacterium]|jgi:uncharacterized protein YecE (DUF72 family)|nr:hypothetical protein [Sphingobacteriaceae bacterium]